MTNLEKVLQQNNLAAILNDNSSKSKKQKMLDDCTPIILRQLGADDLIKHNRMVYDMTVKEYAQTSHNQDIIDELLLFMNMLPDRAHVLDIGCGTGRDALFMAIKARSFRQSLMGRTRDGMATHERFCVPQKAFVVTGIDFSREMQLVARDKAVQFIEMGLLMSGDVVFFQEDMHHKNFANPSRYDGIWSCTALFTHTPRSLLDTAMEGVCYRLKPGGLFFTSYTNGCVDEQYDKLLLSSTGYVKYFSQPDPDEITKLAKKYDMTLKAQMFSDFEVDGKILKPNLFVSQFFRKAS